MKISLKIIALSAISMAVPASAEHSQFETMIATLLASSKQCQFPLDIHKLAAYTMANPDSRVDANQTSVDVEMAHAAALGMFVTMPSDQKQRVCAEAEGLVNRLDLAP